MPQAENLLRILLIEADPVDGMLMDSVLRRQIAGRGHVSLDVAWAQSTLQALNFIEMAVFDVVLVGRIPPEEGTTQSLMASLQEAVRAPIIMLVHGLAENGLTAELVSAGVEYFLFQDEVLRQDHLLREIYHAIDQYQWREKCSELADALREFKRMRKNITEVIDLFEALKHVNQRLEKLPHEEEPQS